MGTKKEIIQAILEDDYFKKFMYLCNRDKRSKSNLGKVIIEKYIDEYEKIHGEIDVSNK